MKFRSTRRRAPALGLSEAMLASLAPDGGLYVPEDFPQFRAEDFDGLEAWGDIGARLLAPFFEGDALQTHLPEICREAFNFPVTLRDLDAETSVLELFHGPTGAFKDVGARFLAACVSRLPGRRTVLVATSGDTGGAVAAAFHGREQVRVCILFPKGKVSPRQQQQLTCWGGNVTALAVRGDFDDCQRVVKEAFMRRAWAESRGLLSANSINLGRLLPQSAYYAAASLWHLRRRGAAPGFVIPSGNLGNAVAAFWARRMGLPVREIALASNENRAVPEYFATGAWAARATVPTLANAMDVGNPSNAERLFDLHTDFGELRRIARAYSVTDEEIARTIREEADAGEVFDPHTATAVFVRRSLKTPREGSQTPDEGSQNSHWVVVSTAHPAKFESTVEPLIGRALEVPACLAELLERPARLQQIDPTFDSLAAALPA
ncbi:MAG TPA: threonine synthase [Pyrinomonadaceae bacterium]|nr:threonine synthase [Pyrinomonadaceae bacterium]